jgi:hypothetical protein
MGFVNKQYGQTTPRCFFCGKYATVKTTENLPACAAHRLSEHSEVCPVCKTFLDVKEGRFGAYFFCWVCTKNWSTWDIVKRKLK